MVIEASPTRLIDGLVESTTCTVLETGVAAFPELSLTVYVTKYEPNDDVSTDPDEVMAALIAESLS